MDRSRFSLSLGVVNLADAAFKDLVPEDVNLMNFGCNRVRHALPKIMEVAWRMKPDVVFSTLGHLNLALAMLKPLFPARVRVVGRESTVVSVNLKFEPYPRLQAWCYRRFYGQLDRVFCQSEAMREDLIGQFALPVHKTCVIPNPVDIGRIQALSREELPVRDVARDSNYLKLVSSGRLSVEKGFDLLIDAVALCSELPIHLTILGSGPLEAELRELAKVRGVAERIRFAGFQKNPFAWFSRADALILSSRFEGFPNVVLEALACGTPVIATPAPGGTREIIGTIAQCETAEAISAPALAGAIRRWAAQPRRRVPQEAVSRYAVGRITSRYEEEILKVAA